MKIQQVNKIVSLLSLFEFKKIQLNKIKERYKNFTGKIVIISDLHIPFVDIDVFNYFFDFVKNDRDIKLLVIAGDFVNFDKFSRFLHLNEVIDADREIKIAKSYIDKIISLGKHIIYLKANHEKRLEKFLFRNLSNDVAEDLIKLGLSLENFFRYEELEIIDNWFLQIGDCIIAHPEVQSLVRGRATDWVIEYFETRIQDFNCVILGHTHKQIKMWRKKKLGVEIGAMCKVLDYITEAKCSAYRVEGMYKGFGITEMLKGKTDFNNTNFVFVKFEENLL